jgi:hypothetical protein
MDDFEIELKRLIKRHSTQVTKNPYDAARGGTTLTATKGFSKVTAPVPDNVQGQQSFSEFI